MRWFLALVALIPTPAVADSDPALAVDSAVARWELSCRSPNDLGDCTRSRTVPVSHHCETEMREVTNRRNAKAARVAQADIAAALAALEKLPDAASDPHLVWVGVRARTAMAEAAYEALLALRFPTGLDFSDRAAKASKARFDLFVRDSGARLEAALAAYRQVASHPGANAALRLRAVARSGQAQARFAELLLTAEIPRDVRTGPFAADKIAAFCDEIGNLADVHEESARAAFDECRAWNGAAAPWAAVCP